MEQLVTIYGSTKGEYQSLVEGIKKSIPVLNILSLILIMHDVK
jgi:hypothetical protein